MPRVIAPSNQQIEIASRSVREASIELDRSYDTLESERFDAVLAKVSQYANQFGWRVATKWTNPSRFAMSKTLPCSSRAARPDPPCR
jgi:hypothetical protein